MHLILDIGNTRTKLGVFEQSNLVGHEIWDDWDLHDLQNFMERYPLIQRVAVSTVTYIWEEVEDFLRSHFFYVRLTHETPIPIDNAYATPATLGRDRLAAVIGAFDLYPTDNCLVIDAGTCIKYDILLAKDEGYSQYIGGNIAPGINMRLQAMHHFTAKLPKIEQADIQKNYGTSTETALRNGGQLGAAMEMQAFIDTFRHEFGQMTVILTGGDANYFAKKLKTQIFVHPNLVLIGLNKILTYNVKHSK